MSFPGSFFGWWNNATIGTRLHIFRHARKIGEDEEGNSYFETNSPDNDGKHKRYIIYNGAAEPSRISADWHGWMHHILDKPPIVSPLRRRHYEQAHLQNLTGTDMAWRPANSLAKNNNQPQPGYEAWQPDA